MFFRATRHGQLRDKFELSIVVGKRPQWRDSSGANVTECYKQVICWVGDSRARKKKAKQARCLAAPGRRKLVVCTRSQTNDVNVSLTASISWRSTRVAAEHVISNLSLPTTRAKSHHKRSQETPPEAMLIDVSTVSISQAS